MEIPNFNWQVNSDVSIEHKFDVRSIQFGDGYEQRQPKFLKTKMQVWSVKTTGNRQRIAEIRAFLDARRGVEPFYWHPPGREKILVKVGEYTEAALGGKVYELSFKFQEIAA